jgi:hypothetical protein
MMWCTKVPWVHFKQKTVSNVHRGHNKVIKSKETRIMTQLKLKAFSFRYSNNLLVSRLVRNEDIIKRINQYGVRVSITTLKSKDDNGNIIQD